MTGRSPLETLYPFLHGGDGGKMARLCVRRLIVPTTPVRRIRECHVAAYRILQDLVHTLRADDWGAAISGDVAA